jgi:hypothetical protein
MGIFYVAAHTNWKTALKLGAKPHPDYSLEEEMLAAGTGSRGRGEIKCLQIGPNREIG